MRLGFERIICSNKQNPNFLFRLLLNIPCGGTRRYLHLLTSGGDRRRGRESGGKKRVSASRLMDGREEGNGKSGAPPGTVSASVPLIRAARSDRKLARGCGRPLPPPSPTRQHGGRSGTTHTHTRRHVHIQICLGQKSFFNFIFRHPRLLPLVSCQTSNSEIGHGTTAALTLSWRTQLPS